MASVKSTPPCLGIELGQRSRPEFLEQFVEAETSAGRQCFQTLMLIFG
jgi:hypothetical protein